MFDVILVNLGPVKCSYYRTSTSFNLQFYIKLYFNNYIIIILMHSMVLIYGSLGNTYNELLKVSKNVSNLYVYVTGTHIDTHTIHSRTTHAHIVMHRLNTHTHTHTHTYTHTHTHTHKFVWNTD